MTDEREELVRERARLEAELSELGGAIDDTLAEIAAIESDLAEAIWGRDEATERFLPDDRLPASVNNDTRDAIASHLDTLAEQRDVRSEAEAMKREELGVERKNATDARDDIEETTAVIDRLDDRTDEAESELDDARAELDEARDRFEDDTAELAARLATFDIGLTPNTLGAVIDERIPEQKSEMQESMENARARIAELSARKSGLAAEHAQLASIDGSGTCPTCSQEVGPDRTGDEADENEEALHELERQLGAAERERDELIARRAELVDLRDQAIALGTFRSEAVAGAAGRVEDNEENVADLQADLDEERTELTESKRERDRADAAIASLETEIADLDAEIDSLAADAAEGRTILETFEAVDGLRGHYEELRDELADLQEENEEMEVELASLERELEDLPDDE